MKNILVGIIMGSDSDLKVMSEAAQVLDDFGIEYEVNIVSAHRTPNWMVKYAKTASTKGIKIIIAGAGGAAHLPGMIASFTPLPIIGVPIMTTTMKGIDSLFSIAQMPAGVPVATVAINGAKNAGLLAIQILALSPDVSVGTPTKASGLMRRLVNYKSTLANGVAKKADKLKKLGYAEYLKSN